MRVLTQIGKKNEEFFSPLLMGAEAEEGVIRLGVISDGHSAGVLTASIHEEEASILHLYVREEDRHKGNGGALLSEFLSAIEGAGIESVTAAYPANEAVDSLLTREGFLVLPGDEICILEVDDLLSSKQVLKIREQEIDAKKLHTLSSLSIREKAEFMAMLSEESLYSEDLAALDPDEELSAVVFSEEKARAALLAQKAENRCLVQFLCNTDRKAPRNLQYLLIHLTKQILMDVSFQQLCFYAEDTNMVQFAQKMVGDASLVKREVLTSTAGLVFSEGGTDDTYRDRIGK